jgi:hypothetical protein
LPTSASFFRLEGLREGRGGPGDEVLEAVLAAKELGGTLALGGLLQEPFEAIGGAGLLLGDDGEGRPDAEGDRQECHEGDERFEAHTIRPWVH